MEKSIVKETNTWKKEKPRRVANPRLAKKKLSCKATTNGGVVAPLYPLIYMHK
jgi:hypothetical protein